MAATTLYVRKGGSDNNGGSSSGTSAQRTGTDGVANGTTTFTSASASFVAGDVDKLINVTGKGRYRITAVGSSTSVTLSGSPSAGSSLTWNIGGAVATVGALLQAAAGTITDGDAIWIGAGTYRETITCTNTNTAEVTVTGDVDGAKTGDVGMVQITAYTTNDKTAPSASSVLSLNGKDYLTFSNIMFVGGGTTAGTVAGGTDATNIKFTDCCIYMAHSGVTGPTVLATASFGTALNWTFTRCYILGASRGSGTMAFLATTAASGADYDMNVVIRDSVVLAPSGNCLQVGASGTAASRGNGFHAYNCLLINNSNSNICYTANNANLSSTIANIVSNCVLVGGFTSSASGGKITENYNLIIATTPRTNVSAGANSISNSSYAPLFHFGQERIWGGATRPFGMPMTGSPLLGFGNDGNQSATDLANGIRPAGGSSSSAGIGPLERANTWGKETSTVRTGSNALSITGPGYQDFDVPVSATATTVGVWFRYDSTYAGTRPTISVVNGTECGVANASTTVSTSALNDWAQATLSLNPTSAGIVTIRLISYDTNGGGKAFADDFTVT